MPAAITRRDFMRTSATIAAAAFAPPGSAAARMPTNTEATPGVEWRNKQPGMRYRKLGRTGFMISEIVCGGDPIEPDNNRHVAAAIEMGLNYLDSSPAYGEGKSEMGYGALIQGAKRERVFINTKVDPFSEGRWQAYEKVFESLSSGEQVQALAEANQDIARRHATLPNYMGHYFTGQLRQVERMAIANALEKKYGSKIDRPRVYTQTIFDSVEGSLRRFGTDHLDLLMCPHGAASPDEVRIPEIYEAFEKLKKQGKVRFLGVSAHNDPAGVLHAAMESGVYSMAMIAYNVINRSYVEPVIAEAPKHDFGVIAMKTSQAVYQPDRSTKIYPERAALLEKLVPGELGLHQKAYRYALNNPNISAVISNMVDENQMRENLPVAMNS